MILYADPENPVVLTNVGGASWPGDGLSPSGVGVPVARPLAFVLELEPLIYRPACALC